MLLDKAKRLTEEHGHAAKRSHATASCNLAVAVLCCCNWVKTTTYHKPKAMMLVVRSLEQSDLSAGMMVNMLALVELVELIVASLS